MSASEEGTTTTIDISQFFEVDMRVGRVIEALPFPEARVPAIKLHIDFGDLGKRWSSAQLTRHYRAEDLLGRLIVAVVNLPPRRVAGFKSEVLVLGACPEPGDVILLAPDSDVEPGCRIA